MFPVDNTVKPYTPTPTCPMCPNGNTFLQFMAGVNKENPTGQNVQIVTCGTCGYAYFMAPKT